MNSYQTTLPPSAVLSSGNSGSTTFTNVTPSNDAPAEAREIAQYIERLRVAIGSAEHSVDALEARMEPVLCPPAPQTPQATAGKDMPVMTKLGACLSEFEARVRSLSGRVGDINQRTLL